MKDFIEVNVINVVGDNEEGEDKQSIIKELVEGDYIDLFDYYEGNEVRYEVVSPDGSIIGNLDRKTSTKLDDLLGTNDFKTKVIEVTEEDGIYNLTIGIEIIEDNEVLSKWRDPNQLHIIPKPIMLIMVLFMYLFALILFILPGYLGKILAVLLALFAFHNHKRYREQRKKVDEEKSKSA